VNVVVKPLTRQDRALRTRTRIIDAAASLFASQGYAGTTMEGVAREANVAVQTVYLVFRTKPELLIETMVARAWRPDARTGAPPTWTQDAAEAADGARRLAIAVDGGVEIYRRVAPLYSAFIAGSSADPGVRGAWQRVVDDRRTGMGRLVSLMHDREELRDGLSAALATDIMVGLHRHELFLAMTAEGGWSVETFKAWLYRALCRELLPRGTAKRGLARDSAALIGMSFAAALETFR
jgi:AcrR family transcriptional regulator